MASGMDVITEYRDNTPPDLSGTHNVASGRSVTDMASRNATA
jgi:hypothetical protein